MNSVELPNLIAETGLLRPPIPTPTFHDPSKAYQRVTHADEFGITDETITWTSFIP